MQVNTGSPVTFLINSLCEGGAEKGMITLSKELLLNNQDVTILALAKNDFYDVPSGVNLIYLSEMSDTLSGLKKMFYIPYHSWKLKKYVQEHKVLNVQSHLFRANFVNLFSRVLGATQNIQVVNHTVVTRFLTDGLSGKVNLFLIGLLYPKADLIVNISQRMQEEFHKQFSNKREKTVIYNPYNVEEIIALSHEKVENFNFEKNKRYLVTVGRLIELKRFSDVLNAMVDLPFDVELILLGDGEERTSLENLAKSLNLEERVHFLGQVKNPFKYIEKCDLFISSSSVEGFPNVLVESMLCKTVVISSDCVSGPREILAPKTDSSGQLLSGIEMAEFGVLYSVADVNSLNISIKNLLDNNQLKNNYVKKAFKQAQLFSVESIALKYREVLSHVKAR